MLEPISTLGRAAAVICACSASFKSWRSGALSWMKSACATHSSTVATNFRRDCEAPGARPWLVSAPQALAVRSRSAASAPGAGSQAITSSPWASARATQPLPITPVPNAAKVLISVTNDIVFLGLSALFQAHGHAAFGGRHGLAAQAGDDFYRALGERAIASGHAFVQPEVVF